MDRKEFLEICDGIDASVFSSDTLHDLDTLNEFLFYIKRWGNEAISTHDMLCKEQGLEVFKLQRHVFTNDDYNHILAYNEDRSKQGEFNMCGENIKKIFGEEYKVYVLAKFQEDGNIQIEGVCDGEF